jgi:hypothetical protein
MRWNLPELIAAPMVLLGIRLLLLVLRAANAAPERVARHRRPARHPVPVREPQCA